jgi:hypothetical protein
MNNQEKTEGKELIKQINKVRTEYPLNLLPIKVIRYLSDSFYMEVPYRIIDGLQTYVKSKSTIQELKDALEHIKHEQKAFFIRNG